MRNNETGRSMVEMLGVLAIIGVLSVAGIAGYSMAMKKIKVNDAASAVAQCAIFGRTYKGGSTDIPANTDCTTVGVDADSYSTTAFTAMKVAHTADSDEVTVTVTAADGNDGKSLAAVLGTNAALTNSNKTITYTTSF